MKCSKTPGIFEIPGVYPTAIAAAVKNASRETTIPYVGRVCNPPTALENPYVERVCNPPTALENPYVGRVCNPPQIWECVG